MSADQLAPPLTSFIGRLDALTEVAARLDRSRLVTLTGAGGCGKTRLALEVVAALQHRFADGAAFVDLAPVEAPAIVPIAFAAATGVHEAGTAPIQVRLADALGDREVLLLVDNCERVAEACAELVDLLLARCPRLVVLATSRSPLRSRHEATWRVPSLSVPDGQGRDLEHSEAGRLLLDRALLASPGFTLAPVDRAAAALVCRRLDGIPLAIELAASRLRAFDVVALAEALEDRFRLLTTGARSAPPRQRTLEASIEWSHDLLGPGERVLFRRLGVFAAAFTSGDVSAVCADADLVEGLVHASLVNREMARYRMLESVREYARMRLAASGEESGVKHRHLDHVLEATRRFNIEADGPGLDAAIEALEPMVDDLRGALEWASQSGRIADGLRLAADLRLFWVPKGRNQEGQAWLTSLMEADCGKDLREKTRAGLAAAELCFYARNPVRQAVFAAESLVAARQLEDPLLEGWALVLAGWAAVYGEPVRARALLTEGRASALQAEDLQLVEFASYGLGTADAMSGQFGTARESLAAGVAIARTSRQLDVQYGLGLLGYVDVLQGRLASAMTLLQEATSSLSGAFDRVHRDMTATWMAVARLHRGEHQAARSQLQDAIAGARAVGSESTFAALHLGLLEGALGNHEAALATVTPLLPAVEVFGAWYVVQAMVCVADAAAALGDHRTAALHWRGASRRAEDSGNPLARTVAAAGLARLAAREGDSERTRTQLRTALRTAWSVGFRIGAIDALEALGAHLGDAAMLAAAERERAETGSVRLSTAMSPAADVAASIPSFEQTVAIALKGDPRPERPASGWDSLTAAEMRVATLVAEGLTNPEIAERLLISRRTVQTHLSHVYDKLGLAGRVALAAALTRRA